MGWGNVKQKEEEEGDHVRTGPIGNNRGREARVLPSLRIFGNRWLGTG